MKKLLYGATAALAAVLALPVAANAALINAGACTAAIFSNECSAAPVAVAVSAPGVLSVPSQVVGNFTLSGSAAASAVGTGGLFNSQAITLSTTTGGIINVYFTVNGIIPGTSPAFSFTNTFTSNNQTGTFHQADLASYLSNTNGLFDLGLQTTLAGPTLLNNSVLETAGPFSINETVSSPFSLTEVYHIQLTGCSLAAPCSANLTIDENVVERVPEPASLALLGVGLLGLGFVASRKRSA